MNSITKVTDLDLLNDLKKGNKQAFTILFNKYTHPIYYMVFNIVNNKEDAEDIVITAFTKAFININSFTPKYLFSTWLFTIAKNTAFDFIRSKNRKIETHDGIDILEKTIVSDYPNPEQIIIRKESLHRLKRKINKLSGYKYDIIKWKCFMNYSYKEINANFNIKENLARTYFRRARNDLRDSLNST